MNAVPDSTTEPMILRADADGVATSPLNRPGQFNALSQAMLRSPAGRAAGHRRRQVGAGGGAGWRRQGLLRRHDLAKCAATTPRPSCRPCSACAAR